MARFFQTSNTTKELLMTDDAQATALEEVVNLSKEQVQAAALTVNAKTNTLLRAGPLDLKLKTKENYVTQAINRIDVTIVEQSTTINNQNEYMADVIGNITGDVSIGEKFDSLGGSLVETAYDMKTDYEELVNATQVRDTLVLNSTFRATLTKTPIINSVHDIKLFINTIEYLKGIHFTVALHPVTRRYQLTWTFTEEMGGFNPEEDFEIIAEYFTKPATAV